MPRIKWSERGLLDLIRLHEFLAPKSRDAAMRAVNAIRQRVKILAAFPEIGRPVDGLSGEFRELVIEFGHAGYVVWYRYDGERVFIVAVRSGREAGY